MTHIFQLDTALLGGNLTLPLTVLGMIGLTSYLGVKEKGGIKLGHNQAMVVSGAAGACGSIAGQVLCGFCICINLNCSKHCKPAISCDHNPL